MAIMNWINHRIKKNVFNLLVIKSVNYFQFLFGNSIFFAYIYIMENTVALQVKVSTLNYDEYFKKVYGNGGMPLDPTAFDRIKYFSADDFHYLQKGLGGQYTVLETSEGKIIGVAKIAHFGNNKPNENSISYFSIDLEYRNRGYARIMAEEVFRNAKDKGYDLDTSHYSYLGKLKIQHLFNEMALKYDVKFTDQDNTYLHDYENSYDENLIHRNEMKRFEELQKAGVYMVLYHPKHIENWVKTKEVPALSEKKKTGILARFLNLHI